VTFLQQRGNDENDMCSSADLTYSLFAYCSFYNRCYVHNKETAKIDDNYIYHAYTLFSLFSTFLGYQKPRMTFLEEGEDDAELPTNHTLNVVPPIAMNVSSTSEQHELTKRAENIFDAYKESLYEHVHENMIIR
jgi:hypothetical protein